MPFAGRRVSGYGVGGIGYTMRDMLQDKLIVLKSISADGGSAQDSVCG